MKGILSSRVQQISTWTLLACLVTGWIFYALLGHRLIDIAYQSQATWIVDKIMAGRAITPVESYHRYTDHLMVLGTVWLLILYFGVLFFLQEPLGAVVSTFSFILSSFLLFSVFEMAPSLIKPLHLDALPYYTYKAAFLYDDQLVYREIPFNHIKYDFRGDHYSPIYGIDVPVVSVEWTTDKNGFRNSRLADSADVVVLGDSYLEYGETDADTFVKRLENKLPGLTTINLGKTGYGPPQYLEVLKRFGVKYKPKYALLAFFEGNDIENTKTYLQWKRGEVAKLDNLFYQLSETSFLRRYWLAMQKTAAYVRRVTWHKVEVALTKIGQMRGYYPDIHPDLAVLNLGGKYHKALFVETLDTRLPNEILKTEEWAELRKILVDFKSVCAANNITPLIVYIPTGVHIYAPYFTDQSGITWRGLRDEQIAARDNIENAVTGLAQDLNIGLISLTPSFEHAAKEGKLLYYALDPHWNSEGRELAASLVADILKSKYISLSRGAN